MQEAAEVDSSVRRTEAHLMKRLEVKVLAQNRWKALSARLFETAFLPHDAVHWETSCDARELSTSQGGDRARRHTPANPKLRDWDQKLDVRDDSKP